MIPMAWRRMICPIHASHTAHDRCCHFPFMQDTSLSASQKYLYLLQCHAHFCLQPPSRRHARAAQASADVLPAARTGIAMIRDDAAKILTAAIS